MSSYLLWSASCCLLILRQYNKEKERKYVKCQNNILIESCIIILTNITEHNSVISSQQTKDNYSGIKKKSKSSKVTKPSLCQLA